MRFLLFIIIVLSFSLAFAQPDTVFLEMGDSFYLKNISRGLWIENPKVIKIDNIKNPNRLIPLKIGSSQVRLDKKLLTISIIPPGSNNGAKKWQKLVYQFADLKLGSCTDQLCLKGKITDKNEFLKLIRIIQEQDAPIYFGFTISDKLNNELSAWYAQYFRSLGYTPLKVVYSNPWSIYASGSKDASFERSLRQVGLHLKESNQKIDIADNVKVEIKIVEVRKEYLRTLGIRWPNAYSAQVVDKFPEGFNPFSITLEAEERSGDMNVLASPNLICRSGKSASFFAGGEFPIRTISPKSSSVQWKNYGINLQIKPIVDSVGQISLELETEISSLDMSHAVDGVPAIYKHKVSSHFDLINSKTIALSGLIKSESGQAKDGLPFLSQVPILGSLFSSQNYLENKTELIIFVRPQLLQDSHE